ncbi:helix-turn-helix domain-containing protein (plasmid) [Azospirillum sp. HJ39]|uniref:helix-turn-helix domain-containing protein n=1 Tax=Azospirillum sp. HJ39 TaxID=3159496 RepID=UPI003555F934
MTSIPREAVELIAARKEKGLTQVEMARATDTTQSNYAKMERGERRISPEWATKFGKVLGKDPALFLAKEDREIVNAITQGREAPTQVPAPADSTIPVRTFAYRGKPGPVLLDSDHAGAYPTPHYLAGVKDAYVLVMPDDSMMPRYRPGQHLHVNPRRTAAPGAAVVVMLKDGAGMVAEFGGWANGSLLLSTYTEGEREFAADDVEAVHLVVGSQEAL